MSDAFQSQLYALAEQVKRGVGKPPNTQIKATINNRDLTIDYTREQFNSLVEPLLARLTAPIVKALKDAKLTPDELDNILYAGRATGMPAFTRHISRMLRTFPNTDKNPDKNPDYTVAMGAAMQAGLIAKDNALLDVVLTDVMPLSLGTSVATGAGNSRLQHWAAWPVDTTTPTTIEQQPSVPLTLKIKSWFSKST